MYADCEFKVGQLVKYRSWYDGEGGWFTVEPSIGIVLEIILITDSAFDNMSENLQLYDIKVFWITDGQVETIPDLLLSDYYEVEEPK